MTWAAAHDEIVAALDAVEVDAAPGARAALAHDPHAADDDADGGMPGVRRYALAVEGAATDAPGATAGLYRTRARLSLGAVPDGGATAAADLALVFGALRALSGGTVYAVIPADGAPTYSADLADLTSHTAEVWTAVIDVLHT